LRTGVRLIPSRDRGSPVGLSGRPIGCCLRALRSSVAPTMSDVSPAAALHGRGVERRLLDRLIEAVRAGERAVRLRARSPAAHALFTASVRPVEPGDRRAVVHQPPVRSSTTWARSSWSSGSWRARSWRGRWRTAARGQP